MSSLNGKITVSKIWRSWNICFHKPIRKPTCVAHIVAQALFNPFFFFPAWPSQSLFLPVCPSLSCLSLSLYLCRPTLSVCLLDCSSLFYSLSLSLFFYSLFLLASFTVWLSFEVVEDSRSVPNDPHRHLHRHCLQWHRHPRRRRRHGQSSFWLVPPSPTSVCLIEDWRLLPLGSPSH